MRYLLRHLLSASCVIAAIVGLAPVASAQSALVDLSKPQPGKSRFVLNTDLTPADLGAVGEPKAAPAALSRVPACGEGCKMEQPVQARADQPAEPAEDRSGSNRSRTVAVVGIGGAGSQTARPTKDRPVAVNAYTRKDGTPVSAHTRTTPSSRFGFRLRRR
jgi:hypothetical protein